MYASALAYLLTGLGYISWASVTAAGAPRPALVPTIVALRRIEAGEFVMLGCC